MVLPAMLSVCDDAWVLRRLACSLGAIPDGMIVLDTVISYFYVLLGGVAYLYRIKILVLAHW